MKIHKIVEGTKTIYYYYIERLVFVTANAYTCACSILFGVMWICYNISKWYFIGVNIHNFLDIIDLFLVIVWLFLIKWNIKLLMITSHKVQILKKTVIEDENGNKIENCF